MSSKSLNRLLGAYQVQEVEYSEDQLIRINQVIGKAALIYEKVRNSIDYKEDHLLRKNALFRILKRKLYIEKILINQTTEKLALQLLQEMIRAGYLKNNQEPKYKIDQIKLVLDKYNFFFQHADLSSKDFSWMLELEACEIEEIIAPPTKEKALIRYAFEVMNHRVITNRGEIEDQEKELQVVLALHRALRKSDDGMLKYLLLNLYYPQWTQADVPLVMNIAKNFDKVKEGLEAQLNHPWKKSLDKIFKRWSIVFWTIRDVIEEKPNEAADIFADSERLVVELNKALTIRYKLIKKRLHTGVFRSIVYVFFTKMLLALVIELPLDKIISGYVNYTALAVNILFPPLLMFFVAITISAPGKKNTERTIKEIENIMFGGAELQTFTLKAPKSRSLLTKGILNILYLCVFAVSVYLIFKGLYLVDFNWVSAMIFVFFLSVVSFFGIRIKKPIKEVMIIDKRDNIFTLLIDFVSLQFATIGRWGSVKFSKVNFVAFIFDFIVEAPFKIFLEVLEDLFSFWREKKEEAYE